MKKLPFVPVNRYGLPSDHFEKLCAWAEALYLPPDLLAHVHKMEVQHCIKAFKESLAKKGAKS